MVFFGTMKSANWPRHCATEVPLGDGRPLSVTEMHRLPGAQPVASELAGARGAGGGAGGRSGRWRGCLRSGLCAAGFLIGSACGREDTQNDTDHAIACMA